ncbi:uncharacterized protein MELLADRAFT_112420 [Melampsora larici-populina 98AG31]|uniref:Secreted protein n=1 Tax=Melampsora larici-populina (strain 98AG31 / pathotype 3-4-7) TaxID=747676 RepID=F4S6F1_MELLP|nr:uncharacterized protein MELLADRAFT_112420 [Melampsora larici-populina 98AG31]EGF99796.1 hypothetical protein MELLADRAFT_112420 [Melampsora larici-populina 98AG31]
MNCFLVLSVLFLCMMSTLATLTPQMMVRLRKDLIWGYQQVEHYQLEIDSTIITHTPEELEQLKSFKAVSQGIVDGHEKIWFDNGGEVIPKWEWSRRYNSAVIDPINMTVFLRAPAAQVGGLDD